MGSIRRGFRLGGQSWRLLRAHKGLLSFPVLGALMSVIFVAPPAVAGAYLLDEGSTVLGAVLIAVATYVVSFIAAYVGVGLVSAADAALQGKPSGLGAGMRAAGAHLVAISGWALITAILSIVLRAIESRGELAWIAASLVGGAWSVISLLALPAITLEDAGPGQAIKRSAKLFKENWGGQIVGMAAVGISVFLFIMLPALALVGIGFLILSDGGAAGIGGEILIGLGIVLFAIGAVFGTALRQIFATVMFRYTTSGEAPQGFSEEDLRSAIRTRGHHRVATA